MSVGTIFAQLRDRGSWPPPPERPLVPATLADLRPAEVIPVSPAELERWALAAREANDGWPPVADDCG
jgi:hypothetical protein